MTQPASKIRDEFDRIAQVDSDDRWNHNNHYHGFLLRHMPRRCNEALEIGCGTGEFARLMAQQSRHVLGLDLSPQMIRLAREQSGASPNVEFAEADVMEWDFPEARYDCIASIATLHHLPLNQIFEKVVRALKPGGILLVLDLYQVETLSELLWAGLAAPVNVVLDKIKNGSQKSSAAAQAAWAEHGAGDVYPTIRHVRELSADLLPGARITRHFFWRYSIIWKKP